LCIGIEVVGGRTWERITSRESIEESTIVNRRSVKVERHQLRRGIKNETQGSSWGYCLLVTSLAERVAQPFQTLVKTVTGSGAGGLDVPGALSQAVQTKLVGDLGGVHGVGKILLVGKDQEESISQLVLVEHALQLLTGLDDTVTIVAVDDEDDTLGVLEVMSPEGTDLVLTADIPDGELNVLVLDSLDVETDCGDGGNDFTELQLVENGGLSGSIETDHENSHLLLSPEAVEQTRECETHIGGVVDKSVVWEVVIWVMRSSLLKRTSDGQRTLSTEKVKN